MTKISIALCTFNGARYLQEQLDSILAQKRLPDELVVGDDCSTDETSEILNNFAAKSPFTVKAQINERNLGVVENFQRTIERCSGDIIFLSDQDDVWDRNKIYDIAGEFEANERTDLIFSDAELVDERLAPLNKRLWTQTFPEEIRASGQPLLEILLHKNVVTGATAAFRSRLCRLFLPIPNRVPNLLHDDWIALTAALFSEIRFIEKPLIKYRQHSGQQIGAADDFGQRSAGSHRYSAFSSAIKNVCDQKKRNIFLEEKLAEFDQLNKNFDHIEKTLRQSRRVLTENLSHLQKRRDLPRSRVKRVLPVMLELLSGRYHRFSKGFGSALKDQIIKFP